MKQGARATCKHSERNGYKIDKEYKKEKIVSCEIGVTSKG